MGELVELAVDDFWQIADAGDQEIWRVATVVNEVPRQTNHPVGLLI